MESAESSPVLGSAPTDRRADVPVLGSAPTDRRADVLKSALSTFARFGYRKTSMEQVAADANISRPGLYFMFDSKQALFREAVERSLLEDLAAAERSLAAATGTLPQRLRNAFDDWTGRYLGPLTRDVAAVVQENPDLVGPVARSAPERFAEMVLDAIAIDRDRVSADRLAQTLISTSIGIKHQVEDRQQYLRRLAIAIDLLLNPHGTRARTVPQQSSQPDQAEA